MGSIRNSKAIVSQKTLKKKVSSEDKETKVRASVSHSSSGSGLKKSKIKRSDLSPNLNPTRDPQSQNTLKGYSSL